MKRKREAEENNMEIVWQTPANLPEKHDYIFRDGKLIKLNLVNSTINCYPNRKKKLN